MGRSFAVGAITAALLAANARAAATTISLNDDRNTTFTVELVSHIENTWTYRITEEQGRDLSHWTLGIECLLDQIESYTPAGGVEIGTDGSTGFAGIKWNVPDAFGNGLFSLTLDEDYPQGTVPVLAKAGNRFATGAVAGPDCLPMVPSPALWCSAGSVRG